MNIILLSGGSGKRLWPLSNDIRSKQFIKIFKNDNGEYESMVQRVFQQIKKAIPDASITIATSKSQVSTIKNQLESDALMSIEPCKKDTFPAIVLAAAYLQETKKLDDEEVVVVCPIDPYVDELYFQSLNTLADQAAKEEANLVLMGIEPTYPSEKYGYIIPVTASQTSSVKEFKEKPNQDDAKAFIEQGALWNSGVFAFKMKYIMGKAHELIDFTDYTDLLTKYESLPSNSFDYAVVEEEPQMQVIRYSGEWKDLGTWNTLTEAMDEPTIGKAVLSDTCENVNVINELNIPIVCMGLKDVIVSASPEGILVSDRNQSSYIKPIVDEINQQIMFAEKSWGSFRVIDVDDGYLTIRVTLNPGHSMNYHSHELRDEIWNVVDGEGVVVVDGMEQPVKTGDVITMQAGCRHTVIAITELRMIEVQIGKEISVDDKRKFTFDF